MANFAQSTQIGNNMLNGVYETSGTMQLGIANYRESQELRTLRYLHFKTNVPKGGNQMIRIDATGYDYAGARPIRCSWAWYSYNVDGNLYGVALQNMYLGMIPNAVYHSADNFVCISASARDLYYLGVTLDACAVNSSGLAFQVAITASGTTTTAGNFY